MPKNEMNCKSGFHECWTEIFGFTPSDFSSSSILDIWNFGFRQIYTFWNMQGKPN